MNKKFCDICDKEMNVLYNKFTQELTIESQRTNIDIKLILNIEICKVDSSKMPLMFDLCEGCMRNILSKL